MWNWLSFWRGVPPATPPCVDSKEDKVGIQETLPNEKGVDSPPLGKKEENMIIVSPKRQHYFQEKLVATIATRFMETLDLNTVLVERGVEGTVLFLEQFVRHRTADIVDDDYQVPHQLIIFRIDKFTDADILENYQRLLQKNTLLQVTTLTVMPTELFYQFVTRLPISAFFLLKNVQVSSSWTGLEYGKHLETCKHHVLYYKEISPQQVTTTPTMKKWYCTIKSKSLVFIIKE